MAFHGAIMIRMPSLFCISSSPTMAFPRNLCHLDTKSESEECCDESGKNEALRLNIDVST